VTSTPTRPSLEAERRKQLRQRRRQEYRRQWWRITLLTSAAVGLGWGLLRQGWVLHSSDQIELLGSSQLNREQVIREAQLQLPQPLLSLKPQELAQRLSTRLPVEHVQVSRLMLPPRLRISVVEPEAVAQAQRHSSKGIERGYVDHLGNWMTSWQKQVSGASRAPQIMVIGWQERLRGPLTYILAQQNELGSTLQQVRFEPNGSIWLRTAALGDVHLGPPDQRLSRRLEVLRHLSIHLQNQIKSMNIQSVDLRDPERPELALQGLRRISIATLRNAMSEANRPPHTPGTANQPAQPPAVD
jgi:cell division protein FtsQ